MKLRKHIRAKRLEDIAQLGVDRVVDFRFGSGDGCHHVILEMCVVSVGQGWKSNY